MNFQQLEYILAIDTHKLFSQAAFSCNVTQATLSAMVIKLEQEVGFPIFDRTVKPVSTTELGEELLKKAREILSIKSSISQLGTKTPSEITGSLTIGVIPTIANSLLSRILPDLLHLNPDLSLKVKEITTEEIVRNLKLGTIDIGIASTPLADDHIDEEILYYEPMLVYGIKETNKKYVISEELMDDKIWLLEEGHCFREQVTTICGLRKKADAITNLTFEGNSFDTLLTMVDTFGGYTLIPELYYSTLDKQKQNRTRSFQKPIPVREVSIISYAPAHKNITVTYLTDFIKDRMLQLLSSSNYANKDLSIVGIF